MVRQRTSIETGRGIYKRGDISAERGADTSPVESSRFVRKARGEGRGRVVYRDTPKDPKDKKPMGEVEFGETEVISAEHSVVNNGRAVAGKREDVSARTQNIIDNIEAVGGDDQVQSYLLKAQEEAKLLGIEPRLYPSENMSDEEREDYKRTQDLLKRLQEAHKTKGRHRRTLEKTRKRRTFQDAGRLAEREAKIKRLETRYKDDPKLQEKVKALKARYADEDKIRKEAKDKREKGRKKHKLTYVSEAVRVLGRMGIDIHKKKPKNMNPEQKKKWRHDQETIKKVLAEQKEKRESFRSGTRKEMREIDTRRKNLARTRRKELTDLSDEGRSAKQRREKQAAQERRRLSDIKDITKDKGYHKGELSTWKTKLASLRKKHGSDNSSVRNAQAKVNYHERRIRVYNERLKKAEKK